MSNIEHIGLTSDGWTSSDNKHSLISLTVHFIDQKFRPKFYVISTKPIKGMEYILNESKVQNNQFNTGRHTAEAIVGLIRENLNQFNIADGKIVAMARDTENTMKKVSKDLGFESIDCTAHVIQLVCFSFSF